MLIVVLVIVSWSVLDSSGQNIPLFPGDSDFLFSDIPTSRHGSWVDCDIQYILFSGSTHCDKLHLF